MKFTKIFLLICLCTVAFSCKKKQESVTNINGIARYQYYDDIKMWNHIYGASKPFLIPQGVAPRSIMIPHHDIAIDNQNSFYSSIAKEIQPDVIAVISPDHFEKGENIIILPKDTVFKTPDGEVQIDYDLINTLSTNEDLKKSISLQDDVWFEEHGIFAHTPFISHYFPNAKVVPVLVKMLSSDSDFKQYEKLGSVLNDVLSKNSLVIASVDCSHYQIPCVTEFHDFVTINTLMRYEDPRYAEIDSPETMSVLFSFNKQRKINYPVFIHQSQTLDYIPREDVESTSHLYISYYDDQPELKESVNQFFNDVPKTSQRARKFNANEISRTLFFAGSGKTGAKIRKTWVWDRYETSTNEADILLKNLGGKEGRFLYGFDELIFDPEPGDIYQRKLHNTNLIVETVLQNDFEKLSKSVYENYLTRKIVPYENSEIRVLEVVLEDEKIIPQQEIIEVLIKKYDVIVFRDDEGIKDAMLYCRKSPSSNELQIVNLGICHGKGNIKGAVAFINFSDSEVKVLSLDYESPDGIIPAIQQKPLNPDFSLQPCTGGRED